MDFKKLANQYRNELLDNVLPFWIDHSQDGEYGGYFTCLDREGRFSIRISSFGCRDVRYGRSPCFTTRWRNARNGWTVPFKVANF